MLLLMIMLTCAVNAQTLTVDHQIKVQSKTVEWQHQIGLKIAGDLTPNHNISGNIHLTMGNSEERKLTWHDWVLKYTPTSSNIFMLMYNHPLFTSSDMFKGLHQDFYSEHGISVIYEQKQPRFIFALAEQVPLKKGEPSTISYLQFAQKHNHWLWQGTYIGYDSRLFGKSQNMHNYGTMFVAESHYQDDSLELELGIGIQQQITERQNAFDERKSKAFVMNGQWNLDRSKIELGWQYIEPDFNWPLSKTTYTSNRMGITTQFRYSGNLWKLILNMDRLRSLTTDRNYRTTNLRLEYGDRQESVFVSAHWHPNQRVELGFKLRGLNVEFRPDLPQIKCGYKWNNHEIKIASSSLDIRRIEYRYNDDLSIHIIYKKQISTQRSYGYAAIRGTRGKWWYQLSIGESDQGSLTAKFDQDPQLLLAWGWSW